MTTFIIPPPDSVYNAVMSDGAVIKVRRYGNLNGDQVLLSHGNGCAIDGYFPYWRLLLKTYDCIVFDFRNYGRNPVHEGKHCYKTFCEDMLVLFGVVDSVFGKKRRAGIFHSMSARTHIKLALDDDCKLDGMVLFDPPMVPPTTHSLYKLLYDEERILWRWSAGRPDTFGNATELANLFKKSRMLSGWVEGAYELMAQSVLRKHSSSENWHLVCSGQRESSIYQENAAMNIWPSAGEFSIPILLIGADPESDIPSAPAHACRALSKEKGWLYKSVSGTGHFLQLQEPEICARLTIDFLSESVFKDTKNS